MARKNLKKVEGGLQAGIKELGTLATTAAAAWAAERKLDADAIAAHIQDVRDELDWIVQWEAQQVDHARACALQMRQRAQARLTSLQGHLAHIKDDGGGIEIEAAAQPKRLNGAS